MEQIFNFKWKFYNFMAIILYLTLYRLERNGVLTVKLRFNA